MAPRKTKVSDKVEATEESLVKKTLLKVATREAVKELYDQLKNDLEQERQQRLKVAEQEELAEYKQHLADGEVQVNIFESYLDKGFSYEENKEHLTVLSPDGAQVDAELEALVLTVKANLAQIFSKVI